MAKVGSRSGSRKRAPQNAKSKPKKAAKKLEEAKLVTATGGSYRAGGSSGGF